jgi:hypothetical protein
LFLNTSLTTPDAIPKSNNSAAAKPSELSRTAILPEKACAGKGKAEACMAARPNVPTTVAGQGMFYYKFYL